MKREKIRITAFLILGLTILWASSLNLKHEKVSADGTIVESATYGDMVVRTAINGGEAYTNGELVDYGIFHGKVLDGNIQKFTTYTADTEAWSATLGNNDDNASASHWQLCTLNDDGIIAAMTAKESVQIDITRLNRGGWEDPCVLGIYKRNDGGITTLKEFEITSSTSVSEFTGSYDLVAGETLYYEFRMPWSGDHRNMQELPSFTFTQKEVQKQPTVVSASWASILENVNKVNGKDYSVTLVDYSVKHGNVKKNEILDFETLTSTKFTSTSGAIAENWQNVSTKNDGVILSVKANKYVNLTYGVLYFNGEDNGATILQGWTDSAYLNIYKMTEKGLVTLKEIALKGNDLISDICGEVVLETNEVFYYEFKFEWDDSRNMQNLLPSFTATEIMHEMTHTYAKEATCLENGNVDYYYCSECNQYFSDPKGENELASNAIETPKANHTLTHVDAKEATCLENGNVEYYHCSVCEKYFSDEKGENELASNAIETPKANHTLTHVDAKEATCLENGNVEYYHCSVCEKYFSDEKGENELASNAIETPKANHTIVIDEAVEATCTHSGLTEGQHCSVCKEILIAQEEIDKLPHQFGEFVVVKEATYEEEGREERVCQICGEIEARSLAKLEKKGCNGSIKTSTISLILLAGTILFLRKKEL